jgi:hypothetical protein
MDERDDLANTGRGEDPDYLDDVRIPQPESKRHYVTPSIGEHGEPKLCWCNESHTLKEAMQLNGQTDFQLAKVTYEFDSVQAWFDQARPIGMCNACVSEALQARNQGIEAPPMHAGVTTIAQSMVLTVSTPLGSQPMPVVLPLASCFTHIRLDTSGQRKIQPAAGPLPG